MKNLKWKALISSIIMTAFIFGSPATFTCVNAYSTHKSKAPKKSVKKEATVYITNTGKKYYRGNCRTLKKSKTAIKLSKAKSMGYTPCKVCHP